MRQLTVGFQVNPGSKQQGLHRSMIPVPVLTPRLSSLWLGLVTPVYARVGRKLIESLPHESVIRDPSAREAFPEIRPRGYREALELAACQPTVRALFVFHTFDEADLAALQLLEQQMHALGFMRHPEHGFWVTPGMPITAKVPNAETVAAIEELEAGGGRVYDGPAATR